jgi:antirestriction protein ArdC
MDAIAFGSIEEGKQAHDPQDHPPEHCPRADVYEEVTAQIIVMLEAGTRPWSPRWASGAASLPLRHEGTAYRGINILLLWTAAMTRGFINPIG